MDVVKERSMDSFIEYKIVDIKDIDDSKILC